MQLLLNKHLFIHRIVVKVVPSNLSNGFCKGWNVGWQKIKLCAGLAGCRPASALATHWPQSKMGM